MAAVPKVNAYREGLTLPSEAVYYPLEAVPSGKVRYYSLVQISNVAANAVLVSVVWVPAGTSDEFILVKDMEIDVGNAKPAFVGAPLFKAGDVVKIRCSEDLGAHVTAMGYDEEAVT